MGLPCLKATCALKAPKTTAAFVLQILSKLKCLLVLDFSMPQAFDRFPGGSDRTPPPTLRGGCSPWRSAVDNLSQNEDTQVRLQETMACKKLLPA